MKIPFGFDLENVMECEGEGSNRQATSRAAFQRG
jgi:hypothetical protein